MLPSPLITDVLGSRNSRNISQDLSLMAELDIDDILRAQGSGGESDEDDTIGERILDTEAFDRRLEEILNAEDDDEEDSEGACNSFKSELALDPIISESYKDEGSLSVCDDSTSSFQTQSPKDDGMLNRIPSQLKNLSEDIQVFSEEIAQNFYPSLRETKVSDSLQSGSFHMNADDEPFSKPWALPDMHVASSTSRKFNIFSQDMSSTLSSVAVLNDRISTAIRPGAALTEATAASTEARTPQLNISTRSPVQREYDQEGNSSKNDSLAVPSADCGPFAAQVADVSNVYAEFIQQSDSPEKEKQVEHVKSNPPTSNEEIGIQSVESEDDISVLDENEEDVFDADSPSAGNSITISSDDDSEQEEIKSILSRELIASEFEVASPPHPSTSEVTSFSVARPKSDLTESQNSALDKAEEAEKKAALSGFGIEEGAASQPMRLKGLQLGPPNIGHVQLDVLNSVSQILSLATTMREHGTAQAITMHGHLLAVGLSKGSVFLLSLKNNGGKFTDAVDKPFILSSSDKSHSSVTSLSFNMQGDLLLVGHANGFLALWELSSKGGSSRPVNVEHTAAILHTAFLYTKYQKAISADCKGLVLLHSISWSTFGRYSVTSQCLVDGQNTGMVLCLSPLLLDFGTDNSGHSNNVLQSSTAAATSTALTSMVGGMVRGVVAGKASDHGKRYMHEGGIADEAGNMVVFVTHQSIIVFRLPPMLEKCAMLARPEGIRDGAIPYIAWRRLRIKLGSAARSSVHSPNKALQTDLIVDVHPQADEDGEKDNHLLLVLGWDKNVFILDLLKGELKILRSWDMDSVICGVTWLDEQIVAVVTLKEQLCVFTKEGLEVQRVAIESNAANRNLELSYHTHMLNTFGNPEKTYFNSLTAWPSTMYLLGPQRIYRAHLLPWQDQLRALQDAGDWMGAFHVGMELFDGRALAVVGLPRAIGALRKIVTPTLLNLLSDYIDEVFTYLSLAFGTTANAAETAVEKEELISQAKEQYARVGGVAIEFCVHIHQTDVLFNHIFHKFCAAEQRGTFLELLEPYILKDTLGALAPEVMQGLVEYYSRMGWVQRVELCVLHMDIASLDFNQVVKLCRENRLYSALIYLFNKGLDDYRSPLEELLVVVQNISNPHVQACGYKLLIYLKYCFLGLAFPPGRGEISATRLPALRSELLQCLLEVKPLAPRQTDEKQLIFQSIIHPRLSCLLAFDLKATLEVLRYAFPENGPLGIGKKSVNEKFPGLYTQGSELVGEANNGLQLLQEIVGALIDILERIHLHTKNSGSKSPVEVDAWRLCMAKIDAGHIMEFIADFVASRQAKISRVVLARILDYLASVDRKTKVEDARRREGILVKILNGVPESEWDSAYILELALQSHLWQASACLLAKTGDLVAALDSYMKDKEQPYNGFLFILDVLSPEKQLRKHSLAEFRSSVLARLPELLQLSSEATLVIMLKHFSKEHRTILADLAPYPPLLFQYLKQIMNARLGYKSSLQSVRNMTTVSEGGAHPLNHDPDDKTSDFSIGNENLSDLLKSAGLDFSNEMEELYVELLCQFEPKSVLKFLKSFEDYRLEHCLKLCQDYGIADAAAYLLERVGDISSALSLVLANMDYHMHDMDLSIARLYARQLNTNSEDLDQVEPFLNIPEVAATCSVMQAAVALCQRNTWRMNPVESEALWFRLLDRFVEPLRKLHEARKLLRRRRASRAAGLTTDKESSEGAYKWKVAMISRRAVDLMQKVLVYLIGEIVNGMMGYIPLSSIMDKLLSNNGRHEFGDFKGTILQMLGLYGYEKTILLTAKQVVEDDMFHKLSIYKRRATRGYAPCSLTCCICKHRLHGNEVSNGGRMGSSFGREAKSTGVSARHSPSTSGTNFVMIFSCGHAAHSSCIVPDIDVKNPIPNVVNCPICLPKISLPSGRRTYNKLF